MYVGEECEPELLQPGLGLAHQLGGAPGQVERPGLSIGTTSRGGSYRGMHAWHMACSTGHAWHSTSIEAAIKACMHALYYILHACPACLGRSSSPSALMPYMSRS